MDGVVSSRQIRWTYKGASGAASDMVKVQRLCFT